MRSVVGKTVRRTQRTVVMLGIRLSFRTLELVAPKTGSSWAERLWFTAPRTSARVDAELPAGTPFELPVEGHPVAGQVWGAGPLVVLVHGWGGRWTDCAGLIRPLVDSGHRVIAFDAPGHGQSASGPLGRGRSTIIEFSDALQAVCEAYGPARAVIAHSLGCMATGLCIRDGLTVDRLVLVAPMARVLPYTGVFAERVGFGRRILDGMNDRIERRVSTPLSSFDLPDIGLAVQTPPVLLVHDHADPETMFSDSVAINESWRDSRLHPTSGLGHRRVLRDPSVLHEIVDFIGAADRVDAACVSSSRSD